MNAQPPGRKVAKPRNKMPRRGQARKPTPPEPQLPPSPTPPEAQPAAQPIEMASAPVEAQPAPIAQESIPAPQPELVYTEPPAIEPVPEPPAPMEPTEMSPPPQVEAELPREEPQPEVPVLPAEMPQPENVQPRQEPPRGQEQPRRDDRWDNRRNRDRRDRNDRRDFRDNRREDRRDDRREDRRDAPRPPLPEMGPPTRGLTLLGAKTTVYTDQYTPALLEAFDNRHLENDFFVKFNCPEFTSLCPITGQPDFATIYISYIPDRKMVESKSLKLYLFSFRNHGAFHEDCVNTILKDLVKLLAPRYIEVWGKFLPRGGLSIDPYANYGKPTTRWEEFARQRLLMHDLNPERVDNR